jgi:hypothetical protein
LYYGMCYEIVVSLIAIQACFFYLVQGWKCNNLKRRESSNFRRE